MHYVMTSFGRLMRLRLALILSFLLLSPLLLLAQNTYHVDAINGNDSSSGDFTHPWRTVNRVNDTSFSAGTQVLFKRGCVWYETLIIPSSGSGEDSRIVYGAYGSGARPLISATEVWTLSWTSRGGNLYTATAPRYPGRLWINGVEYGTSGDNVTNPPPNEKHGTQTPDSRYRWWMGTQGGGTLWLWSDHDPSSDQIKVANSGRRALSASGKNYITLRSLHFAGGNECMDLDTCQHVLIDSCTFCDSTARYGLLIEKGSDYGEIRFCTVIRQDTVLHSFEFAGQADDAHAQDNIAIRSGNYWNIHDNVIADPGHDAVSLSGQVHNGGSVVNWRSKHNKVHHNEFYMRGDYGRVGAWNGIEDAELCSDDTLFANVIHDMRTTTQITGARNVVAYNLFRDQHLIEYFKSEPNHFYFSSCLDLSGYATVAPPYDNKIWNNTFYSCDAMGIVIWAAQARASVKNNLLYNCGQANGQWTHYVGLGLWGPGVAGATIQNNLIYSGGQNPIVYEQDMYGFTDDDMISVVDFNSKNGDSSNVITGNLGAAPVLDDTLAPKAGSPVINAGLVVGLSADKRGMPVPFGGAPEIGVYEVLNFRADVAANRQDVALAWDKAPQSGSGLAHYVLTGPQSFSPSPLPSDSTATHPSGLSKLDESSSYVLSAVRASDRIVLSSSTFKAISPKATILDTRNWSDLVYIDSTVTIEYPNGSVTIDPGTKVCTKYTDNASLGIAVYGRLTARGDSVRRILFTSDSLTSAHSSWGDIQLYAGSTDTLEYCTVQYAQIGIASQATGAVIRNDSLTHNWHGLYFDSYAPTAPVYHNKMVSNGSSGIYTYSCGPTFRRNISRGNPHGFWGANYGISSLDSNTVDGYSADGLRFESNAGAWLVQAQGGGYIAGCNTINSTGSNSNSNAIYAGYTNFVGLSYYTTTAGRNGVFGVLTPLSTRYDVWALTNAMIYAFGNYWDGGTPRVYSSGAMVIDTSGSLTSPPVSSSGFGKIGTGPGSTPLAPLDSAMVLALQGNSEGASAIYARLALDPTQSDTVRMLALTLASDMYQRLGKSGFRTTFLTGPAAAVAYGESSRRLQVMRRELEAHWANQDGDPAGALSILETVPALAPGDGAVAKNALLARTQITAHDLGQKKEALALATQLKASLSAPDPAVDELPRMIDIWTRLYEGSKLASPAKIQVKGDLPAVYALSAAYPNPFNPETSFRLELPKDSHLTFVIYDILGRKVATVADGVYQAGTHLLHWNAHSASEHSVASGVYFARLEVKNGLGIATFMRTAKILLLK